MRKALAFAALCFCTASGAVFADQPAPKATPAPSPNGAVDCSALTPAERQFSSQLTDSNNQMMFCSKMTADQRSQVMQMASQPDATGKKMPADQAMTQYMQQNNMVPAAPQAKKPSSGGGCPVK